MFSTNAAKQLASFLLLVLPGFTAVTEVYMYNYGRDPFNQHSDRSDREKRTTSKGGPVFPKLFRLDRTDSLSFGPKFPEILVEWIAPYVTRLLAVRLVAQNSVDSYIYMYSVFILPCSHAIKNISN